MAIKSLTARVTYKIDPKPDGGFIARSSDPAVPAIEAPTREELQKKIQATIAGTLAAEFPGLKLTPGVGQVQYQVHIERPGQNLTFSSANAQGSGGATPEEINQFAGEFAGLIGKNFPQLAEALAERGAFTKTGAGIPPVSSGKFGDGKTINANLNNVANTPITPEASGSWRIVWVIAVWLVLAALTYFVVHHR